MNDQMKQVKRMPSFLFMMVEAETGACGPVVECSDAHHLQTMMVKVYNKDPHAHCFRVPHYFKHVAYVDDQGQLDLDVPCDDIPVEALIEDYKQDRFDDMIDARQYSISEASPEG